MPCNRWVLQQTPYLFRKKKKTWIFHLMGQIHHTIGPVTSVSNHTRGAVNKVCKITHNKLCFLSHILYSCNASFYQIVFQIRWLLTCLLMFHRLPRSVVQMQKKFIFFCIAPFKFFNKTKKKKKSELFKHKIEAYFC